MALTIALLLTWSLYCVASAVGLTSSPIPNADPSSTAVSTSNTSSIEVDIVYPRNQTVYLATDVLPVVIVLQNPRQAATIAPFRLKWDLEFLDLPHGYGPGTGPGFRWTSDPIELSQLPSGDEPYFWATYANVSRFGIYAPASKGYQMLFTLDWEMYWKETDLDACSSIPSEGSWVQARGSDRQLWFSMQWDSSTSSNQYSEVTDSPAITANLSQALGQCPLELGEIPTKPGLNGSSLCPGGENFMTLASTGGNPCAVQVGTKEVSSMSTTLESLVASSLLTAWNVTATPTESSESSSTSYMAKTTSSSGEMHLGPSGGGLVLAVAYVLETIVWLL